MIDPTLTKKIREAAQRQAARWKTQPEVSLVERLVRAASVPDLDERIQAARSNRWAGAIPTPEPVACHLATQQRPIGVIGVDGSQVYPVPPVLWTYIQAVAYRMNCPKMIESQFIDIGSAIEEGGVQALEILENIEDLKPLVNTWRTLLELKAAGGALREPSCYPDELPYIALMDNSLLPWMSLGSTTARLHLDDYVQGLVDLQPKLIAGVISSPQSRLLSALIRLGEAQSVADSFCVTEDIPDTKIMFELLEKGERSALFLHGSPRNDAFQRAGAPIYFFFLRISDHEMVRVEIPKWVAVNPLAIELVQSSVLQNSKTGYAYVLGRAHGEIVKPGNSAGAGRWRKASVIGRVRQNMAAFS